MHCGQLGNGQKVFLGNTYSLLITFPGELSEELYFSTVLEGVHSGAVVRQERQKLEVGLSR